MLHGHTSSHIEEGAVGGVEITGVQPPQAQVEYHPHHQDLTNFLPPRTPGVPSCSIEQLDMERQLLQPVSVGDDDSSSSDKCRNNVITSESMESVRSTDSDASELQSLMPKHKKENEEHNSSGNEHELHDAT